MTDITKTFSDIILKTINKEAVSIGCESSKVQLALSIAAVNNIQCSVCKNYAQVYAGPAEGIISIPFLYLPFKKKIMEVIKNTLLGLVKKKGGKVSVFMQQSQTPGKLRMMVYVDGVYSSELSPEEIASLNE